MRTLFLFVGSVCTIALTLWIGEFRYRFDRYTFVPLPTDETSFEICAKQAKPDDLDAWMNCYFKALRSCQTMDVPCLRTFSKAAVRYAKNHKRSDEEFENLKLDFNRQQRECFKQTSRYERALCLQLPSLVFAYSTTSELERWESYRTILVEMRRLADLSD